MLFPALFQEAFSGRCTRIVKAMVVAWPFPYLPVGALMDTSSLEIFQAVLDGLDVLLTEHVHPMRGKLQELDFRRVPREFWTIQAGTDDGDCSAETVSEKQAGKPPPRYERRPRMKVRVDLYFRSKLDEEEKYVLQWAQQRKDSLQLCCENMKIVLLSLNNVRTVLSVFEPEHIKVLELTIDWSWCSLAQFSTYFPEMRNLHTLSLVHIHENRFGDFCLPRLDEKFVQTLVSQFSGLSSLQHLYLRGICFLSKYMKLLLRCLTTPLETLAITGFRLSQYDLDYFHLCPSLCQLKHLDMSGVVLLTLDLVPLRVLLENVGNTLQSLDLQGCRMRDSHLTVLIPALTQCSQLTKLNLYDNDFSMPILKDFLYHTANLRKLSVEQYPAPLQCYCESGYISTERFSHLCHELLDILRARRRPKGISFATHTCSKCAPCCKYDLATRLCFSWP
ncbi:PRAME family member 12 [Lemmus lemmus]